MVAVKTNLIIFTAFSIVPSVLAGMPGINRRGTGTDRDLESREIEEIYERAYDAVFEREDLQKREPIFAFLLGLGRLIGQAIKMGTHHHHHHHSNHHKRGLDEDPESEMWQRDLLEDLDWETREYKDHIFEREFDDLD